MRRRLAATLLLAAAPAAAQQPPAPAAATTVAADPAVRARADQLSLFLGGSGDAESLFSPAFRSAIPAEQFRGIADNLTADLGQPRGVARVRAFGQGRAEIVIGFERGSATIDLALEPGDPHRIAELRITARALANDSMAAVGSAVAALPGHAAIGVYAFGDGAPQPLLEQDADHAMPLGSAFKLWVLAEAERQVAAGQRRWADVVRLGPPSLPSGITQGWPRGEPVTVQTLATLMISISDNSATDTLMRTLGRAAVDRAAAGSGLSTPVLTTREAFVLKGDAALRWRWSAMTPPARAALLARDQARFDVTPLATGIFAKGPVATDTAEWFASPRATAALLDRLRQSSDATTRDILAINPGVPTTVAERFGYLGFKGGSEPGVLTLNYLLRTRSGHAYAVAAAWHRTDGETPEAPFAALVTRALTLLADR
ncbi:Beta-lactamase enzyme family protein [Sphingomonas gellani]|uniref:Beta-lactamase enzyme family protein n=1 Tax=Sphingomonas gellani TaxID=1166340 RepID=A0A1H7YS22_9SPHN|nr:serine hydrolase [Sphingomonas gellani]SEM48691.1 Beta-lactamase enzyme family protein [Sphingomonas gellani]